MNAYWISHDSSWNSTTTIRPHNVRSCYFSALCLRHVTFLLNRFKFEKCTGMNISLENQNFPLEIKNSSPAQILKKKCYYCLVAIFIYFFAISSPYWSGFINSPMNFILFDCNFYERKQKLFPKRPIF